MIENEDVPPWLGVELISSVVALEDGRLRGLANASGGYFTEKSLAERLHQLGARPISRQAGDIQYQTIHETPENVIAVAVAEAEPQDLGMLMNFTFDPDMEWWSSEVVEIDWAAALLRRSPARVQAITRSDRGY
jgi:hypothetical protein